MIERYLEKVVLASFPVFDYGRDATDRYAFERDRTGAAVCRRINCRDRVCQRSDSDHCEYEPLSGIQGAAGAKLGVSSMQERVGEGDCPVY